MLECHLSDGQGTSNRLAASLRSDTPSQRILLKLSIKKKYSTFTSLWIVDDQKCYLEGSRRLYLYLRPCAVMGFLETDTVALSTACSPFSR